MKAPVLMLLVSAVFTGILHIDAYASETDAVTIAFITDFSSLYSEGDGQGGLEAIRMAISGFGGQVNGRAIKVQYADHQNKADIAASTVRQWIDRDHVDLIIGGTNSATALATNQIAGERKVPYIKVGSEADGLTNEQCTPYTVHYAYDTMAQARGTASAVLKQGGKTWFFLVADYAFGKSLEKNASDVVKPNGGEALGSVHHPLSASDFSVFLIQAQQSGAQVLGLADAGGDVVNAIKTADQFGVAKTMKLAALLVFINDINSLGLKTAQGLVLTESWYWNKDARTRMWSQRFFARLKRMPSSLQAADYSATLTYLVAVRAAGTTKSDEVMTQLKKQKVDDMYATGYIREDGSMIHDMYLMQVKSPGESKEPWDYYTLLDTIPGEQAFGRKTESHCVLWK
jgi:branched-chain amino acid transport system substrate-binding protein